MGFVKRTSSKTVRSVVDPDLISADGVGTTKTEMKDMEALM